MTRQARSDHFFGSFACLTAATHSSQSPSDSSCSEPSSRFNLSRTSLGGFLAMAVLIALMPSRHSDLSSANANVPLNSRNVMAMNQSRASERAARYRAVPRAHLFLWPMVCWRSTTRGIQKCATDPGVPPTALLFEQRSRPIFASTVGAGAGAVSMQINTRYRSS